MTRLIYFIPESIVTWRDSGGTEVITLASLATVSGRQGARHDFGDTTERSRRYRWRFFCQFSTAPVVNELIHVLWKTEDNDAADNDDGTGDAAVSAEDKLKNLTHLGSLMVDEAAINVEMSLSGEFRFSERFGSPVIWNDTADTLHATAANNGFNLQPVPDNIQDEV